MHSLNIVGLTTKQSPKDIYMQMRRVWLELCAGFIFWNSGIKSWRIRRDLFPEGLLEAFWGSMSMDYYYRSSSNKILL